MANNDQNENGIPISVTALNKRASADHLPRYFRTDQNKKFLGGTLDPLIQPGKLTRINDYIGRKDVPNYSDSDNYVTEGSFPRQYYQLEPAYVYENPVTKEVEWYTDYIDYINTLRYFGAPVGNHSKLNKVESYAWDPYIDWDKFVNFREYYWLPSGPDPISIYGELESTTSSYNITSVSQGDNISYVFTPDGLTSNPRLTLYRGLKYTFRINSPGKPFCIKTKPVIGDTFFYNVGLTQQKVERGTVQFEITDSTPALLYYIDNNNVDTVGMIDIRDISEATKLDVEKEIIGKKYFKSSTGIQFVNGLKVKFIGQVAPAMYAEGNWYVEGVGEKIKLVSEADIRSPAINNSDIDVPFDEQPFDSLPWESALNYPTAKDYIVINRSSTDRNTWSRNNRWFHRSVIETAARANKRVSNLDQTLRASRPIIEFDSNIKLHKYGWIAKKDVHLVDTFTTDVFSVIEGSTGYSIDGVSIVPGHRILFTADTDPLVNGKIFEVTNISTEQSAKFIGSISGTTLTVTSMITGTILVGHLINSSNVSVANTIITANGSSIPSLKIVGTGGELEVSSGTYIQGESIFIKGNLIYGSIVGYDPAGTTYYIMSSSGDKLTNIRITDTYAHAMAGLSFLSTTSGIYNVIAKVSLNPGNGGVGTYTINKAQIAFRSTFDAYIANQVTTKQINLVEVTDTDPAEGEVVYVIDGSLNRGSSYYYQNNAWKKAQQKISVNQAPLFDLFDENTVSFSDESTYSNNKFSGNRLFGYKIGTGTNDTELGFPISHLNINNTGDIQFEFDIQTQTWTYKNDTEVTTISSKTGFVRKYDDYGNFVFANGWTRTNIDLEQAVVRILIVTAPTDLVPVDVYDDSGTISDIKIRVYVNNIKRSDVTYQLVNSVSYMKFGTALATGDKVVYKVRSVSNKNLKGYYEIPLHWQNNPLNNVIENFTFGEVTDHVHTIVENLDQYRGNFPGLGNLNALGNVSAYGRRFLKHAGSMPLSAFLLTDRHANIVKALRWTSRSYSEFKKEFLRLAKTTSYGGTVAEIFDQIMYKYSHSRHIDTSPFHSSDMFPYGASSDRDYTVVDPRMPYFIINSIFDPQAQDKRSILVYLNDIQLVYGQEYFFSDIEPFVQITHPLELGDKIKIRDYASTDGCYVPFTPTKLGLYPAFVPGISIDYTYREPTEIIQGHDGSIIKTYGDIRDQLLLELEKRIYNTCRVTYDDTLFNIHDVLGGHYRRRDYTKEEINEITLIDFLRWNSIADQDFASNDYWVDGESFTYNYNNSISPVTRENLYGYWRGIYKYFYDTDRPHTHPWEMQGYSIKPYWWERTYGAAPYTNQNKIMWDSIEAGKINDPNNRRIDLRYARPGMSMHLPVDGDGNLISPLDSNLAQDFSLILSKQNYDFGDQAPVETAWRRSSEYPYSVMVVMCLLRGSEFITKMWDRFTVKRNLANQIYYTPTGDNFRPSDLIFSDVVIGDKNNPNSPRTFTSGLANIIEEYIFMQKYVNIDQYKTQLTGLNAKLSHRMGGFTSKDKIKVLLDSRTPNATGTVFLPTENYKIFYDKSEPVDTVTYSGVIVEKLGTNYPAWQSGIKYRKDQKVVFQNDIYRCTVNHTSNNDTSLNISNRFIADLNNSIWIRETLARNGFKIKGYDTEKNYFEIFPIRSTQRDINISIGGISESYVDWTSAKYYIKGQIIADNNRYYRAKIAHTSSPDFAVDAEKWAPLAQLPTVGGVSAYRRTTFDDISVRIPYGTVYETVQEVVDFFLGYQKRLEDLGFEFTDYSKALETPLNWLTSAKEFMFWTLQNWSEGAVITLSPAANSLTFVPKINASVDQMDSDFYDYSILKADGTPLNISSADVYRSDNGFTLKPGATVSDGIFHIRTNLVYREHILLLDNVSVFNDVVYDVVAGYRQGRVKLYGFKTTDWKGGFETPGFMYDEVKINEWMPSTDYNIGDIVKYKNYYFTAANKILGANDFNYDLWTQINSVPDSGLIPNFDYRIEQFRDFYSLDASAYDTDQQVLARHLIGYQKRQYLENIIIDDVAQYKFYQGFIKEKGTYNSITKLFDALRSSGFSTIDVKEEWAFKVGDYGASDTYTELEFPLDELKFHHNPQDIVLTLNNEDFSDLSIYNVSSRSMTIKPVSYDGNPFKMFKLDHSQNDYGIFKYPVAGYVRDEDVNHLMFNEATLLNYDITRFAEKDKIWLGFTATNDWDVLEYFNTGVTVTNWSIDGNIVTLECSAAPDIAEDDIVTLTNLDALDGSYKVQNVYGRMVEIFTFNSVLYKLEEDSTQGLMHTIKSARFATPAAIQTKRYNRLDIRGEKMWVDSDKSGKWLVLENIDAFTESELSPNIKQDNQQYGYDIKLSGDEKWMFVSAINYYDQGAVLVYNRPNHVSKWNFIEILRAPPNFADTGFIKFGTSIDISFDGSVLAVGAPSASNVKSYFVGNYSPTGVYVTGDVVKFQGNFYENLVSQNANGPQDISTSGNWKLDYVYEARRVGYSSGYMNQGMVVVYTHNPSSNRYIREIVLASNDPVSNEQFGSKVSLSYDGTDHWLFVGCKDYQNATGRVQIFRKTIDNQSTYSWRFNNQPMLDFTNIRSNTGTFYSIYSPSAGSMYGYDISSSVDGSRVAVSAPFLATGAVYVFDRIDSIHEYELIEIIDGHTIATGKVPNKVGGDSYLSETDMFGYSIKITNNFLFASCPNDDIEGSNVGSVYCFEIAGEDSSDSVYQLIQLIVPPTVLDNERFGSKINLSSDERLLVVAAMGGSNVTTLTFDKHNARLSFSDGSTVNYELDTNSAVLRGTSFDGKTTTFHDTTPYTGSVFVYNRFDQTFIYGDRLSAASELEALDNFGASLTLMSGSLIVGSPAKHIGNNSYGSIFIFDYDTLSWNIKASQDSLVDVSKFKKAFIYNTAKSELISNLDFYDPAKGKIPAPAEQEIKYQTYYDPAIYEYGLNTGVSIDHTNPWTDEHVGELWWNLSTLKYTWYEQGDSTYRNIHWGRLFPGSMIEIYEWVETTLLPGRWAEIADTADGLSQGISGLPKDPDNFTYSSKFKYDPISGSKTTLYYYWVKYKNTVPNVLNRKISGAVITKLILDPQSQGYRYVAATNKNSLSLNNVKNSLINADVSLNLEFYEIDNTDLITHRQYALVADNDASAIIPSTIESKWFDSLVGSDSLGRQVPDTKLSKKQRYGNLNSPRQSWFVNRFEALKQFFEYVNSVLSTNQVVDNVNLQKLQMNEMSPTLNSGDIDRVIDVLYELRFVGTEKLKTAKLSVQVVDGKLLNIFIDEPGYGYVCNKPYTKDIEGTPLTWYGPNVKIIGTGSEAEILTVIDKEGMIIKAEIIKNGREYDSDTKLEVRGFSVLVNTDEDANNGWSIQIWNPIKSAWTRTKTQAYDVTRYWSYKDWYATGYGLDSDVKHLVNKTADLNGLTVRKGDIVKIKDAGYGKWLLLERRYLTYSADFTNDYVVVGKQADTIEFSSKIYNLNQDLGYDTKFSYDLNLYDTGPTKELRIILNALRDDILVDDLRIEYVRSFFNSIHYVLSEQLYTDWLFKTSFLKINHIVGTLKQRATFQSDELASYQSYIEEVKPYKSKIREFVDSYDYIESASQAMTDFDLPPYYDYFLNRIDRTTKDSSRIDYYPWKSWSKNHTYQLTSIVIDDQGMDYTSVPKVIITGGFASSTVTDVATLSGTSSTDISGAADAAQLGRMTSVSSSWTISSGTINITATGLPYHSYGIEYNDSSIPMSTPIPQEFNHTFSLRAGTDQPAASETTVGYGLIGYWLNGVSMFNMSAANGSPNGWPAAPAGFNYNAAASEGIDAGYNFGEDSAGGHASPPGQYHYHDFSFANAWLNGTGHAAGSVNSTGIAEVSLIPYLKGGLRHPDGHSKILGFALDGYPVYGPYGYSDPTSSSSGVAALKTGFNLKSPSYRSLTGAADTGKFPMGIFVQDYEFTGLGDLDIHNGRFGITPDYPNGTYAYFTTIDDTEIPVFPYVLGTTYYGNPAQPGINNALTGGGIAPVAVDQATGTATGTTGIVEIPAAATAYVSNGKLTRIVIDRPGYGYISAPKIYISGGNGDVETKRAKAYAVIGNTKARTLKTIIKFDRITASYTVDSFEYVDTFKGTGTKVDFKLSYAPEASKNKITITVDDIEIYGVQYSVALSRALHDTYNALEGTITFTDAPAAGSTIKIGYYKNIRLYSAADRINYAYDPLAGQYGKDLGQLMTGVDYGGVSIVSLDFDVSSGWDVLNWDVSTWDGTVTSNDDYIVGIDGSTRSFTLPYTPAAGEVINVYIDGKRVDDPYYSQYDGSTVLANGLSTAPDDVFIDSFVGDGHSKVITFPDILPVNLQFIGSEVLFRKSTSDGTVLPTDRNLLDSFLIGGDLPYATAKGVLAEEIVIDGDRFVTADTSHGPEELIQGQLVDALNMKIYTLPNAGGPNVYNTDYTGDGVTTDFKIDKLPTSNDGVIVLVDDNLADFDVDYYEKTVKMYYAPAYGARVSITVIDTGAYDILDKVDFIGDGSTTEFLTAARYHYDLVQDSTRNVSAYITVNGIMVDYTLKESDDTYTSLGNVIVEFDQAPPFNSIIQVMILEGNIRKFSKVNVQITNMVAGQYEYDLEQVPSVLGPLSHAALVIVDGEFLRSPDCENFIYDGSVYFIPDLRYEPYLLKQTDIQVYRNGIVLSPVIEYQFDSAFSSITLNAGVAIDGDEITVEIFLDSDYKIENDKIVISKSYNIVNKEILHITTFSNHDILKIKSENVGFRFKTSYDSLRYDTTKYDPLNSAINTSGIIDLPRVVSDTSGVFVGLNRKLLSPNFDYVVLDNRRQIRVTLPDNLTGKDYIEVVTTSDKTISPSYGYNIFKDMLNRNHYKTLDKEKITFLAKEFNYFDTRIEVADGSVLDDPAGLTNARLGIPCVVEIAGERIEYFVKDGNILRQLRRGTLGTSINQYVSAGSRVIDIGQSTTVPYTDKEIKKTHYGDGSTQIFDLDFTPTPTVGTIDDSSTIYKEWYRETNAVPINAGSFVVGTEYTIAVVGTTNFKLIGAYSNTVGTKFIATGNGSGSGVANLISYPSIPYNYGQCDEIEVFVAGRRLRKAPMTIYDQALGQDSYKGAGDKQLEAEFSVNENSDVVRLTEAPNAGDLVVIVRRTGKVWFKYNENSSLRDSNTDIARFLKVRQVDLPK